MYSLRKPSQSLLLSGDRAVRFDDNSSQPMTKSEEKSERFVLVAMAVTFVIAVLSMKIAIPLAGTISLQITLPIQLILFGVLAVKGRLKVSLTKLFLFALFSIVCLLTAMFQPNPKFSMPSLCFVLVIYASYVFALPMRDETFRKLLKIIQTFGLFVVAMVAMDWLVQFAGQEMPSIEKFIPQPLLFYNYVYAQPLEWGARYMKPNGFFFLETSYVSQFVAMCLILEVAFFQRFKQLVAYGVALVLSFGGTGMTLALLCAPVLLFYFRLKLLPLVLIAVPVMAVTAVQVGLVQNVEKRTQEFGEEGSSGNQRFNAQFERIGEALSGPTRDALFGIGAGQMPQRLNLMWTPISKVFVEYGLFAYGLFWVFLLYSMFGRGVPFIISWMVLMQYLFLNGSFLVPINNFYNIFFAALIVIRPSDRTQLARVFGRDANR